MKPTRIYAEMIDSIALEQFENAMSLTCNVQGALMPDAHAGYTLPIGAVIKSKQMVFPSYVGYDIGCGMCAVKLDIAKEDIEHERLKKEIIKAIPLGMSRHQTKQPYAPLTCTPKAQEMFDEISTLVSDQRTAVLNDEMFSADKVAVHPDTYNILSKTFVNTAGSLTTVREALERTLNITFVIFKYITSVIFKSQYLSYS